MSSGEGGALRRAGKGGASLGALALAVLVPKCPICVAALLSAAGLATAGAREVAPYVRPAAFLVAAVVVAVAVWSERRRARRRCCRAG